MKRITLLTLVLGMVCTVRGQIYEIVGEEVCWNPTGTAIDSSLTRYILLSTRTPENTAVLAYVDENGNVADVSGGGTFTHGFCGCCGGSGAGTGADNDFLAVDLSEVTVTEPIWRTGKVAIGIADSTAYKLYVSGGFRFTPDSLYSIFDWQNSLDTAGTDYHSFFFAAPTTAGRKPTMTGGRNTVTIGSTGSMLLNYRLGVLAFTGKNPDDTDQLQRAFIEVVTSEAWSTNNQGTDMLFWATDTADVLPQIIVQMEGAGRVKLFQYLQFNDDNPVSLAGIDGNTNITRHPVSGTANPGSLLGIQSDGTGLEWKDSTAFAGGGLPAGDPAEVILYDGNSNARSNYLGNAWNIPARGIVAHIGDSNTNGRPGYRDAVNEELICNTCILRGWTSYNVGQNGSTMDGWVNSIGTASHQDSILNDYGPPGSDAPFQFAPGANVWRAVNGDSTEQKPDILIISLGTNDIRNDQNRNDIGSYADLKANLDALVNFYLDTTDFNILLAIPQPVAFTPSGGFDGEWTDQAEADAYSDTLRQVYLTWEQVHPRVQVYDSQEDVFGYSIDNVLTDAQDPITGADLMADILHPTELGYRRKIQGIAKQLSPAYLRPYRQIYKIPEDAYRDAVWGRVYRSRSAKSASTVLDLETTPMGRVRGRDFVIDNGTGRTEDRYIDESANLAGLEAIYQELRDLANDSPDTTYLHFFVSGNTYKATNVTFSQYLAESGITPGWAQFNFVGTSMTESAGPVLIYIKSQSKIPFRPSATTLDGLGDVDAASPTDGDIITYNSGTGNWENTTGLTGSGLAGRPAYWNSASTISAIDDSSLSGGGFTVGHNVAYTGLLSVWNKASSTMSGNKPTLYLQQDRNYRAIQIQANVNADMIYSQRGSGNGWMVNFDVNTGQSRGINIDLDDTGTYLFNTDTYGVQVDVATGIDQDWLYGGYFRANKTRTSVGTNDGHVVGLEARARSSIATVGESWAFRAIAETGSTVGAYISGASGATAPVLQVNANSGVRFQVNGSGEIDIQAPILDDGDSAGTAGQILTSQGSALADAPIWDDLANIPITNPYGGENDMGATLDSIFVHTHETYDTVTLNLQHVIGPSEAIVDTMQRIMWIVPDYMAGDTVIGFSFMVTTPLSGVATDVGVCLVRGGYGGAQWFNSNFTSSDQFKDGYLPVAAGMPLVANEQIDFRTTGFTGGAGTYSGMTVQVFIRRKKIIP